MATIAENANGDYIIRVDAATGNIVLDGKRWPKTDGTANQVLKTDGNGNLSWTTQASAPFAWPSSDGSPNQVLATNGAGQLIWLNSGGGAGYVANLQDSSGYFITKGLTSGASGSANNYLQITANGSGDIALDMDGTSASIGASISTKGDGLLGLYAQNGANASVMIASQSGMISCLQNNGSQVCGVQIDTGFSGVIGSGSDILLSTNYNNNRIRLSGIVASGNGEDLQLAPEGQLVFAPGGDVVFSVASGHSIVFPSDIDMNGTAKITNTSSDLLISSSTGHHVVIDGIKYPKTDGTSGYVLKTNGSGQLYFDAGGAGRFTDLADCPNVYTGSANRLVKVNSTATGLEFLALSEPLTTDSIDVFIITPQNLEYTLERKSKTTYYIKNVTIVLEGGAGSCYVQFANNGTPINPLAFTVTSTEQTVVAVSNNLIIPGNKFSMFVSSVTGGASRLAATIEIARA